MSEDKQVYWDDELKALYWIEWEWTGNSDIPHKHYINIPYHLQEPCCNSGISSENTNFSSS